MKHIIIFLLLASMAIGKPASNKKTAVLDVKKVDIQPNQDMTFNIKDLNTTKAFMLSIQSTDQTDTFNPFNVSITNKDGSSENCNFKRVNNLCVLQKPAKQLSLVVSCLQKRCQSNIVFSQRILVQSGQVVDFKKKLTIPGQLYRLNQRKFNSILEIYSKKEEYQVLSEQIMIYSNVHVFSLQQTHELDASSAIFGIKPISEKLQDQYIFIDKKSNKQQKLAFSIKSHSAQLRDGITVVDFIQNYGKHSGSNYTYVGSISKNLQVKVRVFSPKDGKDIPLTFSVKGRVDEKQEQKIIRQIKFKPVEFGGHNFFDFIFAITHAVHKFYKFISLQMHLGQVQDKSIFFQIGVRDVDSYQTNIFEQVYFGCEAGEILHFTVEPQVKMELSSGDKDIQILTNSQDNYFSSIQSCSLQKGCSIEITAKSVCQHCKLAFELKDEDVKNHVIYYEVRGDAIEGQVELQEEIFFKYSMNSKSASQIVVNSANVIIYANFQNYQRCKIPSAACHQYAINQQNPMVVRNTQDQPIQLVLGVFGLDKTSFKVRFINEMNGLQLKLGEKFSYLMDDEEKDLELKFVLDEKKLKSQDNLHFNLISPLHSLKLTVANSLGQQLQSLQGYITFDRRNIHSELFSITIQKMNQYYEQFVHFTLIVTTSDMALRLDPTITHYEKYLPETAKTFIVEYDPAQVNALNIFTENLQKEKATMILQIIEPSDEEGEKGKVVASHKLMRDNEFIDLDADLQELDICDDNCELEITIKNEGKVQFEQSLTLLTEQSLIGLDDSIWSIFEINQLSRNNHFYFTPRNKGQPVTILFNTDDALLSLDYRIYNTTHSINPQHWPFGLHQQAEKPKQYSSNSQEIFIPGDDAELSACWPTCVVLISIRDSRKQEETNKETDHSLLKSYKILASNNILELLQDTKLQFSLKNQEQKVMFIQAGNILKYQRLTFFSYYSIGRAKITATLISNDIQFKLNGQKDFIFSQLETVIPTYLITSIIDQHLLKLETVLLKITIKAQSSLKMTLEYTSLLKDIYRLRMDDVQMVALSKSQQTLYDFMPQRDFILKLYRGKGFPLFKVFKCNEDNYAECLSNQKQILETGIVDFLQTEERVKQGKDGIEAQDIVANEDLYGNNTYPFQVFVEKSYELIDEQCEKCVYFLWIYCFEGDLELSINLRSSSSEIQLKESAALNERVTQGQHNKYLVGVSHDKDTVITVNVLEGAAKVTISDASGTLESKQLNSIDNSYNMFTINPEKDEQEEETEQEEELNAFGLVRNSNERRHIFKHLHVTITGRSQQATQYIISYSVGSSKIYLQDGIVIQQNIVPQIPHTFLYRNHNKKQHAYLTLSSQLLQDYAIINSKNTLQVKFYYYPDANDRSKKQIFQPQLPPQRNENYLGATVTHVYELPSKYELYEIQVQSPSYLKATASINHQQLVYLPLGFEYLIKLHSGQFLNLAINSPTTEYLEVKIKKCDDSMPALMYTNDAKQFKQGLFEAEVDIDRSNFRQYIKTKKSSRTLHLRLIPEPQGESLLSISVMGSSHEQKKQKSAYKAGNKGIIDYTVIQTDTVEVYFKPATCGSKCTAQFEYYLAVSQNIEQIYSQLNCANQYFIPQASKLNPSIFKTELIPISEKSFRKETGEYRQKVKLSSRQAFIGVKAVSGSEEVLYTPVQIRSFWGELGKASVGILVMACLACSLVLIVVIAVSTKLARRGYKPISGDE